MTASTDTAATNLAALAAAQKAAAEADVALDAARAAVPAAAAKLAQLEDAVRAGGHASKADLQKARTAIEESRGDHEWLLLQLEAAEAAHSRAAVVAAAAQRAVTADEYIAELERFNAPGEREHELARTLTATLAELIMVSNARKVAHHRLATDVSSWPADETAALRARAAALAPAERIEQHGYLGMGWHEVNGFPTADIAQAVKDGIAAAKR